MRNRRGRFCPVLLGLLLTIIFIVWLRFRSDTATPLSPNTQRSSGTVETLADPSQIRLFIGVLTQWEKIERRHFLRHLYPLSLKGRSATTASDIVRIVFVFGEPASDTARSILEWESEMFGDILILDGVDENMNAGKTYHFLKTLHDWQILYNDGGWTHVAKADDDTWYDSIFCNLEVY